VKSLRALSIKESHQIFPYKTFAQRLMRPGGGMWPSRVHSVQRYKLQLGLSDRLRKLNLNFMTFPLERLADLSIAQTARYSDWADRVLYMIDEDAQASRQARQYLQHLDAPEIQPERLVQVYKNTLAQFIFDYKTFVAPSTFMIDLDGSRLDGGTPEIVSQGRYVGMPPSDHKGPQEFIPLSGIARLRIPNFVEVQELNYQSYRQRLLTPLYKEVSQSDTLIVLIDLASLLSKGRPAFDEQIWLLDQLRFLLKNKEKVRSTFGLSQIKKVALIANKCDLVRTFERDARLPNLLRQLTRSFVETLHPKIEIGRFICSPCMATRVHTKDPEMLIGRMIHQGKNPEKIERPFRVPEVPQFWPDEYSFKEYPFLKVWPPALQAHEKLPRHHRLDDVCRFIISPN
jgi:hypothetical protein